MRPIDADVLYEQTAEWEARALAIVEKLNSKPLGDMDVNEVAEWRKWSTVLNERTAFKHDVLDAPTVEVPEWIDTREALPEYFRTVLVTLDEDGRVYTGELNHYMLDYEPDDWTISDDFNVRLDRVTAWMPLPEPYKRREEHADA